jgi:hypothetical protein
LKYGIYRIDSNDELPHEIYFNEIVNYDLAVDVADKDKNFMPLVMLCSDVWWKI